jgi:hypothetical protein
MFFLRSLGIPALLAGLVWVATPAHAFDLNGLWSSDPALCDKLFIKKGKQVVFSELSDLYGSGFIIDGNRIRGKVARCMIKSRKQDGDTLLLSATCSTIIAPQDLEFSLKTVDDNTVARQIPGSSAMRVDFHRCPP